MEDVVVVRKTKRIKGAGFQDQLEVARASVRKSKLIGVHCTPKLVSAIEQFISAEQDEMTRPEAIRRIVRRYLVQAGHYK